MERDENGRFKGGKSGNPQGRPKGIKDRRAQAREFFENHAEELKEKALELAREGDTQALRMCLDRIAPPLKATEETVELPDFDPDASMEAQAQQIMAAAARGEIAPNTASTLTSALQGRARVAEVDELAARLEALEKEVRGDS